LLLFGYLSQAVNVLHDPPMDFRFRRVFLSFGNPLRAISIDEDRLAVSGPESHQVYLG
jgi:hypothetical protein